MSRFIRTITAGDPETRNQSLESLCRGAGLEQLLRECEALDRFRRERENLYERVRALFFLYALHRFHLPLQQTAGAHALIPFKGYTNLLKRRFEEAIDIFLAAQAVHGPNGPLSSALAAGYRALGFQTLADQVRRSVRSVRGNQWMFRTGHPADYPLRIRPELLAAGAPATIFPILREATPVRMDLTHSGWSDIFFLGMDFPEGARVLNVSVDLGVRRDGRPAEPKPPVEAYLRVIDQPVLRLVSVDLKASVEIASIAEVFDFARDYLGLLKAAVIASGIVPPGLEGATQPLGDVLARLIGAPGRGLEIVSKVNDIPKGSRLAVSTNSAGLPDLRVHARHQPDSRLKRRSRRSGATPGGGAGHSGRVAGRIGRRLAGFRRRMARNQAHPRGPGRGRRSGVRHQPRTPAARSPDFRRRGSRAQPHASSCSKAWCWFTAEWRRMSARSWKW